MKKSQLIELLNAIPGNPDIKLWNGMVGDWMDVDKELVPATLVKQTFQNYVERVRLQRCHELKNWDIQFDAEEIAELRQSYKQYIGWECNQFVDEDDVKEKRYSQKNIVYINAKRRGVSTFDRLGNMEY
jgi:hypothetical protein